MAMAKVIRAFGCFLSFCYTVAAPLSGGGAECLTVRASSSFSSSGALALADPGAPALSPPAPLFARFGEPLHLCLAGPLRAAQRYEVKLSFREPHAEARVRLAEAELYLVALRGA